MSKQYLKYLLFFALILSAGISTAQDAIEVEFIGNCGMHFTDGNTNIYTDFPYKSGAFGYMEYDQSQIDLIENNSIFIFTHKHADHYSRKVFRRVVKEKGGRKFSQWKGRRMLKMFRSIPGIEIETYKTKHRFAVKHSSYLITWNGKRIFLSGDAESSETISQLNDIDWAFVPPWLLVDAKENGVDIDAEMIVVYHLYPYEINGAIEEWKDVKNIIPLVEEGQKLLIK